MFNHCRHASLWFDTLMEFLEEDKQSVFPIRLYNPRKAADQAVLQTFHRGWQELFFWWLFIAISVYLSLWFLSQKLEENQKI